MLPIITLEDQVPMVQIGHRQLTQICAPWPSGIESTKGIRRKKKWTESRISILVFRNRAHQESVFDYLGAG
ncbi:hypothetical protein MRB53_029672 [Persea americana]|uniref:Uncharacterized protein n=1 Tax=Persea americana TaxID=3435 RepID=A0ACC2KJ69_PERAE|nr:hypothetical protein MRB53_029672 [Persea americana]